MTAMDSLLRTKSIPSSTVDFFFNQNDGNGLYTGDGSVDVHGMPVLRSKTGNWKACPFILGNIYIYMFWS